jgi:hypothetical protein
MQARRVPRSRRVRRRRGNRRTAQRRQRPRAPPRCACRHSHQRHCHDLYHQGHRRQQHPVGQAQCARTCLRLCPCPCRRLRPPLLLPLQLALRLAWRALPQQLLPLYKLGEYNRRRRARRSGHLQPSLILWPVHLPLMHQALVGELVEGRRQLRLSKPKQVQKRLQAPNQVLVSVQDPMQGQLERKQALRLTGPKQGRVLRRAERPQLGSHRGNQPQRTVLSIQRTPKPWLSCPTASPRSRS